ncbi:MAG: hypothetical protein WBO55_03165 [Rhizobiaceae bacterium]
MRAALLSVSLLALAGCSSTITGGIPAGSTSVKAQTPNQTLVQASGETQEAALRSTETTAVSTSQAYLPGVESTNDARREAWCDYLVNNANAEAEIIASPTLSGSTDDSGNYSLNIGVNLLDFHKAKLVRRSGDAKCKQHSASKIIAASMQLADEAVVLASANARLTFLEGRLGEINSISAQAGGLVANGSITAQQAESIRRAASSARADMEKARAEVDRRRDFPAIEGTELTGQNRRLVEAEEELQTIDRDIRTLDSLSLNLEAGYRAQDADSLLGEPASESTYAKVKFGIRLGALSSRREAYEDAALVARNAALHQELGGPVWRTAYTQASTQKALHGMRSARSQLAASRKSALRTAGDLAASDNADLMATALAARMEAIALGAELAGVDAAIAQMEDNVRRLGALAN